jgi:hypothetical protein
MEILIRSNNLKLQKNASKVDVLQKEREYLLTELDENICKNVSIISENEVKTYLSSISDFNVKYNDSCVKYIKNNNCFLVQYFINSKFYKEELYEYTIIDGSVFYGCIDYSFKQGGIK